MKVMLGFYERTNHVQTWHMSFWVPKAHLKHGVRQTMCDYGGAFCSPTSIKWTGVMTDTPINIAKFVRATGREHMSRACRSCLKVLEEKISAVDRLADVLESRVKDFIRSQR
jgi:hypothetical protein